MTKGERVAEMIRTDINNGLLKAGDKLPTESGLCEKYNVSRTSIRDALNALAVEGVITTYHGKGSFINETAMTYLLPRFSVPIFRANRIDMFEFRRIFEAESAALAALRADEEMVARLKSSVTQMQKAQTPREAVDQDVEFHYTIVQATGNVIMPEVFNMLRPVYNKMFFENVALRGNQGYTEHLRIISAIESRSPDVARKYMAEHLNNSMMQNAVAEYMDRDANS